MAGIRKRERETRRARSELLYNLISHLKSYKTKHSSNHLFEFGVQFLLIFFLKSVFNVLFVYQREYQQLINEGMRQFGFHALVFLLLLFHDQTLDCFETIG